MLTLGFVLTTAMPMPLAYAVELPSSGQRKLTSTRSGRAMLLKPEQADHCPNSHRTRLSVMLLKPEQANRCPNNHRTRLSVMLLKPEQANRCPNNHRTRLWVVYG